MKWDERLERYKYVDISQVCLFLTIYLAHEKWDWPFIHRPVD